MADLCIEDGSTVLFIGDSITDTGRRGPNAPFGSGYVSLFMEMVIARYPERKIRFINQGIGGHTVVDLRNRWEDDVIRYQPDWVSVKVGINDLHRMLVNGPNPVPVPLFRETYDSILTDTHRKTKAQLVVIDPFFISADTSKQSFRSQVLAVIPEYTAVVAEMADKHGARHVKTHEAFQRQLEHRDPAAFGPDPVHPSRAGHMVIAWELMKVLTA